MKNKKQILQDALQILTIEFTTEGKIWISLGSFGFVNENGVFSGPCTWIKSETGEGIYYNPISKGFFYYGELPTAFGGRKTYFRLNKSLISLLPPNLKSNLIEVWELKMAKKMFFDQRPDSQLFIT